MKKPRLVAAVFYCLQCAGLDALQIPGIQDTSTYPDSAHPAQATQWPAKTEFTERKCALTGHPQHCNRRVQPLFTSGVR